MSNVNMFVYGSLKRGYPNHRLLESCMISCKQATIKGTLYDIKLGFPALQLKGNYTIKGELAQIDERVLPYFDHFEGVPRFYQREETDVNVDGKTVKAYVYTMKILPANSSIIKNGQW